MELEATDQASFVTCVMLKYFIYSYSQGLSDEWTRTRPGYFVTTQHFELTTPSYNNQFKLHLEQ